MSFQEILNSPESKTLEFKRDLSSPKPILKTLVAFANTAGGRLLIGIRDDKKTLGVDNPLDEEERLSSLIADAISPRLVPNIELMTVEDKTILVVEVFLSNSRPHYLNKEGVEQGVYVRLGYSNRQADQPLVDELRRSVAGTAFDEMPMPALSVDDLDLLAAQQAFGDTRHLDEQSLLSLKMLTHHQGRLVPSKGAILLFGKQRTFHFSDAWIQCGRFFGTKKLDIFDHIEIDEPLPKAVDEVMLFLKKHAFRGADLSEVRRKDVWSIPLGILREVIINALVHSDYSQRGAPIRVVFLDDRIEVESPGILLSGLTIEEMKQGISRIRNYVIARVFRELQLIEQWGTGVRRIFQEAKELGLPEPKIEEIGMRVRFTVYLQKPHLITQGSQQEPASRAQSRAQSGAQSESILSALTDGSLSAVELVAILGLDSKTGAFKRAIKELLEQEKIEYTIPDKPNSRLQKYRLVNNRGKA
ncbi:MAG: helix-turn-helix domain-containing protein [gamma proteobacterium symbiont of Bathyaustriella thionipta]|nr:helix-turn-helix domain-containing protein [gamma proteobacterium symbiont of Bathyaustriella thionipta]